MTMMRHDDVHKGLMIRRGIDEYEAAWVYFYHTAGLHGATFAFYVEVVSEPLHQRW